MSDGRATVGRLTVALLIVAGGCSTGTPGGVDELSARLAAQTGLDDDRATCVAGYSERTFSPDDVNALAEAGISGLPRNQWEIYQRILTACAFAELDQLPPATGDRAES